VAKSVLSRYLDPDVLSRMGNRRLEPLGLVSGNLAGAHKSPLHGFAVEFAGHREYVPGDDPKHIDWRVYFTREKYFIKQYEMETNFVCHLLLDVSASMRYGDGDEQKMNYAARMASTLGHQVVRQSDKVSFASFDEKVHEYLNPSNSMAQVVRMTEVLDRLEPSSQTRIPECLIELAGRMGHREIVMIFSDFFTDLTALEESLQRLRYQKHEVVLFQVLHSHELTFPFQGMIKFVGLEAVQEYLTQPDDIRKTYLAGLKKFLDDLGAICQRNRIERVLVDTQRNMGDVFIDYLNQRSLMGRAL